MTRISRAIAAAGAVVVALTAAACLQKDVVSTIYLDPDGPVQWVVQESNVRSDADTPDERTAEERAYVEAVAGDRHPVAESFRRLGGQDVRTTVLRDARPWMTMVSASFAGLDTLVTPVLEACRVPHGSETVTHNGVTTWTLWADVNPDVEAAAPQGCAEAVEGLGDAAEPVIMLTGGRFVGSTGFTIDGADRATLAADTLKDEALTKTGGRLVLSLTWTTDRR